MIDYSKVDFDKILDYFNIKNRSQSGKDIQFSCPFPEHYRGDRNPSAGIHTETGAWHCFSCGRKGSLVSFVSDLEGVSEAIAARWVREGFGSQYRQGSCKAVLKEIVDREKVAPKAKNNSIPEAALDLFTVDWKRAYNAYKDRCLPKRLNHVFDRGLWASTLQEYEIGYDTHSKRITIPLRSAKGTLVGFKGRATTPSETPKYLGVGDRENTYYGFPTCKTSEYVFGIHTIKPSDEFVIIVEGEFDAITLRQNGFTTAIALGGSSPSDSQIEQITETADKAILMLDPDNAGKKAERKLAKTLLPFMSLRIAEVPKGLDPAKMNKTQVDTAIIKAKNPLKHIHT